MIPRAETLQRLRDLRGRLDGVCGLLISPSPEVLERCTPMLEMTVSELGWCQKDLQLARGDTACWREARRLAAAVQLAERLLVSGWEYHQRWSQRLGSMVAGYAPGGEPAAMKARSRVCMNG